MRKIGESRRPQFRKVGLAVAAAIGIAILPSASNPDTIQAASSSESGAAAPRALRTLEAGYIGNDFSIDPHSHANAVAAPFYDAREPRVQGPNAHGKQLGSLSANTIIGGLCLREGAIVSSPGGTLSSNLWVEGTLAADTVYLGLPGQGPQTAKSPGLEITVPAIDVASGLAFNPDQMQASRLLPKC